MKAVLPASTAPAPRYVVHYMDVRARAEPIHLLLHFADVPYIRRDFTMAELKAGARAKAFPTSQVPVLELLDGPHAGAQLTQSGSIMRYLAREHGLVAADAVVAARQDAAFELAQEFGKVNPMVNMYKRDEARTADFLSQGAGNGSGYAFAPKLDAAVAMLDAEGGKFFGGDTPCYADFNMWHYLDNLDTLVPDILAPPLVAWMTRVAALPPIDEYLRAKRPDAAKMGADGAPIRSVRADKPWGPAVKADDAPGDKAAA